MLVGLTGLEPEDKIEKHKITENIGFNSSRRNILRNQNLNMNVLPEKTKDDVDKLTYHYLELSDSPKEEIELDKNINTTKSKLNNTNNFYTSFLYPEVPFETNTNRNNIQYDGGTFLTDKITLSSQFKKTIESLKEKEKEKENKKEDTNKTNNDNNINNNNNENINNITNINNTTTKKETIKGEIYSTGFESIPELKHSIPVSFDKLVVNLTDEPGKPKPINPLFFIINGEKPLDKTKFLNFKTNPSLIISTTKRKLKSEDLDNFYNEKKNITDNGFNRNSSNASCKTPKFISCFNKACENKPKLNYDLKKTIFNDAFTHTEDKYKILKDLQRNELMNRALGRGIFSCNKYYDDEKRALAIQKRKNFEKFFENSKDKLVINLRTKIDFFDEKKKSFPDSQSIITHDYLKMVKNEYKKSDGYKEIEKLRNEDMKLKVEHLYRPKSRKKINKEIYNDTKMDKLLKKAHFEYSKPYSYLDSGIILEKKNFDYFDDTK